MAESVGNLHHLYGAKVSTNCWGPWLLLKAAKIDYFWRDVDVTKGEQMTPEFLSMNPNHQVPTFKDADGFVVFESNAIMRYICNKYPEARQYYPSDPKLRAKIETALDWRHLSWYKQVEAIAYPSLGFNQEHDKVAAGKEAIAEHVQVLAEYFIGANKFIGGSSPSIADMAIAPTLYFLQVAKYEFPMKYAAKIEQWFADCKAELPFDDSIFSNYGS